VLASTAERDGSPANLASAEQAMVAARAELEPFKLQNLEGWIGVNMQLSGVELWRIELGASVREIAPKAILYVQDAIDASPANAMGTFGRSVLEMELGILREMTSHLDDAAGLDSRVRIAFEQGQILYIGQSMPIYAIDAGNAFGFLLRPSLKSPFYPAEFATESGTAGYRSALEIARKSQTDWIDFIGRSPRLDDLMRMELGHIFVQAGYRLADEQTLKDGVTLLQATKDGPFRDEIAFGQWVLGVAAYTSGRSDEAARLMQAAYDGSDGMPEIVRGDIQASLGLTKLEQAAFNDDPAMAAVALKAFDVAIKHYGSIEIVTKGEIPYKDTLQLNQAASMAILHNLSSGHRPP